jgi:1-acyl-sn-glycerol-3-phosphate acyltransferase
MKRALDTLCKIDSSEFISVLNYMKNSSQPVIIAFNHINFLEVPVMVAHSYPLLLTGLVKAETWNNPIMAFLADTFNAIPLDRDGFFGKAFKEAKKALDEGFFVCIAPEGTRSRNGVLGRGKAGVVQLALVTGAPVLPIVNYGGEKVWENIRHFKRTPLQFKAGRPFRFKFEGNLDREMRTVLLEELMGQIASLLPEEKRGIYAEQAHKECKYLEFLQ